MKSSALLSLLGAAAAGVADHRVLECHVRDKRQAEVFQGLDVFKVDVAAGNFTVHTVDAAELDSVRRGSDCEVLDADMRAMLGYNMPLRPKRSVQLALDADVFFSDYHSYATITATLAKWADEHPELAAYNRSIGQTHERRDIVAFKITSPNINPDKKGIWLNGGLHAREWIAPAATIFLIHKLLVDADTPRVKALLDAFEFHFTPLANPDGYEFTRTRGNRLWRKNRRDNGDGSFGVDLNRNWDEHWDVVGASAVGKKYNYRGPSANSEPEVMALAAYALKMERGYGGIDFHSYGQYVLRNWGWSTDTSSNDVVHTQLATAMQAAFRTKGFQYVSQKSAELYPASGALDDWMAAKAGLVSYTVELCPSEYSYVGFQLSNEDIVACSTGAYEAFLVFSEFLANNPDIPNTIPLE